MKHNLHYCIGFVLVVLLSSCARRTVEDPSPDGEGSLVQGETFSFKKPAGWLPVKPDRAKTEVILVKGRAGQPPVAMIKVDAGKPVSTLDGTAKGLAEQNNGAVVNGDTTVDGERALRIRAKHTGSGMVMLEALAVLKGDQIYLIMGGAQPGISLEEDIEQIRQSWKWK
jgi:hypothetical protein